MKASMYVGRVGGLAVALGIGAAIFAGGGAAWADDDSGTGSSGASASQSSGGATGHHKTKAAATSASSGATKAKSSVGKVNNRLRATRVVVRAPQTAPSASAAADPNGSGTPAGTEAELALLGLSRRTETSGDETSTAPAAAASARPAASATASRHEITTVPVVIRTGDPVVLEPITSVTLITGTSDEEITGRIYATGHSGAPLTFSVPTQPGDGSVDINPTTGAFTYTPTESGTTNVQFEALLSERTRLVSALENIPVIGQYVPQLVTTLQQTPVLKTILAPLIGHATTVSVDIDTGLLGDTGTTTVFSPYADTSLYPEFDFADAVTTGGIEHFTLGFIVSDPDAADAGTPMWGGYYRIDSPWAQTAFNGIYDNGADAIISFGGSANEELALVISDQTELTAAYQGILDYYNGKESQYARSIGTDYGVTSIDFDIEGTALTDSTSIDTRSAALYDLQQANPGLQISFTLPAMPYGLTSDGLAVIQAAVDAGVDISVVNMMVFDYYDTDYEVNGDYEMGALAVDAAEALKVQLDDLYTKAGITKTDDELYAMIGLTPMIGISDDPDEIFTLDDASTVVSFADQYGLGRIAMWSANRDSQCATESSSTQDSCSGVDQTTWEFSGIFEGVEDEATLLM